MSWQITVGNRAEKQLKRLPQAEKERIEKVIDEMEENPFLGDMQKLGGQENTWRRRIGAYRITYEVVLQEKFVKILEIQRRASNTY